MHRAYLVGTLCLALAACEQPSMKLASVASSRSKATFQWAGMPAEPTEVLETRDPRTGFEVQRNVFYGETNFALLDVLKTGSGYYIERQALRRHSGGWFGEGAKMVWHEDGSTPGAGTDAYWQTFKVQPADGPDLECVSSSRITNKQSSDVVGQEGRAALMGVYCTPGVVGPIAPENAQRIAASMRLR